MGAKKHLGISWLNGRVNAVVTDGRSITSRWESPSPATELSQFATTLRQVIKETGYTGRYVSIVLMTREMVHQRVDAPPIKQKALVSFIQRKLKQINPFNDEVAWGYRWALPGDQAKAIVLHLLPTRFRDELIRACQEAGLTPVRLVTPIDVLQRHLTKLPIDPGEPVLLAAEVEGIINLIVGKGDGSVWIPRTLNSSLSHQAHRVAREINRSILSASQSLSRSVTRIWWFGTEQETEQAAPLLELPVAQSPIAKTAFYWAEETLKLPVHNEANLVPVELQREAQSRKFAGVTAVLTALLVVASLISAGLVEQTLAEERKKLAKLPPESALLTEKQSLVEQVDEAQSQIERLEKFVNQRSSPIGGYFLSYHGEIVPEGLLLSRYQATNRTNEWEILLEGKSANADQVQPAHVKKLVDNIKKSAFRFKAASTGSDSPLQKSLMRGQNRFRVEGRLQP